MIQLSNFDGPILIERSAHLLKKNQGTPEQRKAWATNAVRYLCSIGITNSPHWSLFLQESRLTASELSKITRAPVVQDKYLLEKIIAHQYVDAIFLKETRSVPQNKHFENLEGVTELLILGKNYRSIEELEFRIQNVTGFNNLSPDRKHVIRRIQLMTCVSYFLQENFFDCCSMFFKYFSRDLDLLDGFIYQHSGKFILNEEIIMMVLISCLVSIPVDNYSNFIYLETSLRFMKNCPMLLSCMSLLIDTKFKKFFILWNNVINNQCKTSMFLDSSWSVADTMMRTKIYFFYLKMSDRIEIEYLSGILGIPHDTVRSDIKQLIQTAHLNFVLQDDIISFHEKNPLKEMTEKLSQNGQEIEQMLLVKECKNSTLREQLQNTIIKNNANQDTLVSEQSSADMDMNEINNHSDNESDNVSIEMIS